MGGLPADRHSAKEATQLIVASHGQERVTNSVIVLFTDFGLHGPYTGQMKAVLHRMTPGIPPIDLFSDAPAAIPRRRPTY